MRSHLLLLLNVCLCLLACSQSPTNSAPTSPEEDLSKKYPGLNTAVIQTFSEKKDCTTSTKYLSHGQDGKTYYEVFHSQSSADLKIEVHEDAVSKITGEATFDETSCFAFEPTCKDGSTYKRIGEKLISIVRQERSSGNELVEEYDLRNTETLFHSDFNSEKSSVNKPVVVKVSGMDIYKVPKQNTGDERYLQTSTANGETIQFNGNSRLKIEKTKTGRIETVTVTKPVQLPSGNQILEASSVCKIAVTPL